MISRYISILGASLVSGAIVAQGVSSDKGTYDFFAEKQVWVHTQNAAGLTRDTLVERGVAYFQLAKRDGSYYLTQDGDACNQLQFVSESFKKIGKYLYGYGKVSFDMGRIFNRSWSDVYRSHNSNPYFSGSAVKGKYDTQNFNLSASLASVELNGFTYGVKLDYNVGDLSRLKDPRSRANLAEYRIVPSVTYAWGSHVVGIDASYHRRKEKIPSVTTVQTDPNLMYYLFTGMEHAEGATGSYASFERQFVHHEFEGGLTYAYQGKRLKSVNALVIKKGHEDVTGDMKYMPGKYFTSNYEFASRNRIEAGSFIHHVDLELGLEQSYADEYRQRKVTEKNPETGIESSYWETLITYDKRYKVQVVDASLEYKTSYVDEARGSVKAYWGAGLNYKNVFNEFTLPVSKLEYQYADFTLCGGGAVWKNSRSSLWLSAKLGYLASFKTSLQLADESSEYAQQVLIPDMDYYEASVWHADAAIEYDFSVMLKGKKAQLFTRLGGEYLYADSGKDQYHLSFAFGTYF